MARSAWQPLHHIHLELPCGCSPRLGQWAFPAAAGGRGIEVVHTALSLYRTAPVGFKSKSRRIGLGDRGWRCHQLSNQFCPVTLGCSQLAGYGRALTSTNRHTVLFWEQVWLLALPHLGPGNSAHVAPADEIPERKEPLLSFP